MGKIDNLRTDSLGVGGPNPGLTHKQIIKQSMNRGEIFHSTGTGLSDLYVGRGFTGIEDTTYNFVISETITGTDKFKWRKRTSGVYGAYSAEIIINGLEQTIEAGIIVIWGAITGHNLADEWTVTYNRINALQVLDPAGTEVFSINGSTITGAGDVTGPAGAVAGNVAILDVTGKILSDGGVAAGVATNAILNPAPADHGHNGVTFTATAGENLVIGDACYFKSDGKFWKARGDAAATMTVKAVATGTIVADAAGVFLRSGFLRDDTWGAWTVGGDLYVSAATGGLITQTAPAVSTNLVQIIGFAYAAKILFVDCNSTYVEVP